MGGEEPGQWLAEGATLDRIGDGLGNTALITATITGDFAAHYCQDLVTSVGDWYLPTRLELAYMNNKLHKSGWGEFITATDESSNFYWSSLQVGSPNQRRAYVMQFDSERPGSSYVNSSYKNGEFNVRAVRRF